MGVITVCILKDAFDAFRGREKHSPTFMACKLLNLSDEQASAIDQNSQAWTCKEEKASTKISAQELGESPHIFYVQLQSRYF